MGDVATRLLDEAIKRKEFIPYIQPIVNIIGDICGGEILARWKINEETILTPDSFIQDIENNDLIIPFTESLIDNLVQSMDVGSRFTNTSLKEFHLALNVSPRALMDWKIIDLCDVILKRLQRGMNLTLEITERDQFVVNETSLDIIEKLRSLGVRFSLDDYGTGLSNLISLSCIEFDFIKIDKSFVQKIHSCNKMTNIIKNILDLSQRFDYKVIAEGVETLEQLQILMKLGVPFYQGFYFYKPIEASEFFNLIHHELEAC